MAYLAVLIVPIIVVRPPIEKLVYVVPFLIIFAAGYTITVRLVHKFRNQYRLILRENEIVVQMGKRRNESLDWTEVTAVRAGKSWLTLIGHKWWQTMQVRLDTIECEEDRDRHGGVDPRAKLLSTICDKLKISNVELEEAMADPRHKRTIPVVMGTLAFSLGVAYWLVEKSQLTKNAQLLFILIAALLWVAALVPVLRKAGLIRIRRGLRELQS